MPSELFVVGLSWRTAPVSVREKISFSDDKIASALSALCRGSVSEAMILSTCNRVEIYGCTPRTAPSSLVESAAAEVRSFLAQDRDLPGEQLARHLYEYHATDAVQHIFSVASALDSLVLGETQILGQLKSAFGLALSAGKTGPVVGRCLERAFGTAKRVRTETDVSRGAANISSVAVDLAKRVFGDLAGKRVLLVGAGKMSVLAARHLRSAGASSMVVLNRSLERAEMLAKEVDGAAGDWNSLESELSLADVVITSTAASEPILNKKTVKQVMKKRRYRPIVIVDIAVPRDVDSAVSTIDGVYLFDIDDLQNVVSENIKERSRAAEDALVIVKEEMHLFLKWMRQQHVVPTIRALRSHFIDVARQEAVRTTGLMEIAQSDAGRCDLVNELADRLVNKLLHAPMKALKDGDSTNIEPLIEAADRLFELQSKSVDTLQDESIESSPMNAQTKESS